MLKKKSIKIVAVICGLALLSALCVFITYSYLAKNTEQRLNKFTFGKVDIELTEPQWDKLADEDKIITPSQNIPKDPQIKNTGKNDAYVFIQVSIPKKSVRLAVQNVDGTESKSDYQTISLFTYEINNTWLKIDENSNDSDYNVYTYAYIGDENHSAILAPNESTYQPLFNSVTFANIIEGDIAEGTELEIPIIAVAVQTEYLNEPLQADLKDKMLYIYNKCKDELI